MISRFFIDRPIFAAVLSVFITLAGAIAAFNLPLAQFPQISPPTVSVTCQYPGASAKDVAESVAAPIEQQVNGVEKMMYMSSSCTNDGSYSLTVTFEHGIDLEHGAGARGEPRQPGSALVADRHQADRRHHAEALARHSHGHVAQRTGWTLRPTLPEQLRLAANPRRTAPRGWRQRHPAIRPARLQHAHLGGPR